jgi:hypothetical protein
VKLLYKPFGILFSVLGGLLATRLFNLIWAKVAHQDSAPHPKDKQRGWGEVAAAAVVQGAVYSGVKAVVDRAGATGYEKATGTWPGKTEPVST